MPQILKRATAPIDWSLASVADHPVLNSGVGACILAFASTEALMGVFLAMIRWEHAAEAVETWSKERTARGKLDLLKREAELTGPGHLKLVTIILDDYSGLSARRSKLAHGFFGVITDRENEFAWRPGGAAARTMAAGLGRTTLAPEPAPDTWVYLPKDFEALASDCGAVFAQMEQAMKILPIVKGFTD